MTKYLKLQGFNTTIFFFLTIIFHRSGIWVGAVRWPSLGFPHAVMSDDDGGCSHLESLLAHTCHSQCWLLAGTSAGAVGQNSHTELLHVAWPSLQHDHLRLLTWWLGLQGQVTQEKKVEDASPFVTHPQTSLSFLTYSVGWLVTMFGLDTRGGDTSLSPSGNVREFVDRFKNHKTQETATDPMSWTTERVNVTRNKLWNWSREG